MVSLGVSACARCKRPQPPEELREVAPWIKAAASVALAFVHGGLWASEELSRDYCRPCRTRVAAAALAVSALFLGAAAFGVALLLSRV